MSTTKTDSLAAIHAAYDAATGEWTGCNWTTDQGVFGLDLSDNTSGQVQGWYDALDTLTDMDFDSLADSAEDLDKDELIEAVLVIVRERLSIPEIPSAYRFEQLQLGEGLSLRKRILRFMDELPDAVTWLEKCEESAEEAEDFAKQAVEAAEAGDLDEAHLLITQACGRESEYGDCPTWGPVSSAITAALAEQAEDQGGETLTISRDGRRVGTATLS